VDRLDQGDSQAPLNTSVVKAAAEYSGMTSNYVVAKEERENRCDK
jgi:hypothetical protein